MGKMSCAAERISLAADMEDDTTDGAHLGDFLCRGDQDHHINWDSWAVEDAAPPGTIVLWELDVPDEQVELASTAVSPNN